jgi:hypothetical protein
MQGITPPPPPPKNNLSKKQINPNALKQDKNVMFQIKQYCTGKSFLVHNFCYYNQKL